jgi:hypothetical protein
MLAASADDQCDTDYGEEDRYRCSAEQPEHAVQD